MATGMPVFDRLRAFQKRGRSAKSQTASASSAARSAPSAIGTMRFIGRTLAEDAIVRRHGEPDHNGNHCYLRGDAQNDILFDPLVGMNSGARGSSLIFDHPPANRSRRRADGLGAIGGGIGLAMAGGLVGVGARRLSAVERALAERQHTATPTREAAMAAFAKSWRRE